MRALLAFAVFLAAVVSPEAVRACACGCGLFEVGAAALMPTRPGGFGYLEYDRQDQGQNWSGAKKAPGEANPDKRILNDTFIGGVQYMLDRSWGVMFEAPVTRREFTTTDRNGTLGRLDSASLGDLRARGVYAGFSEDMSSGLTFGLKLPTGPYKKPDVERDTQIGSGSVDLLLGGYHMGLIPGGAAWNWFADGQWDEPVLDAGYRPGAEIAAALGTYYDGWKPGGFKIAPLAQVLGVSRWRDIGSTSDPGNTGYRRVLLSPGIEISKSPVRVYGDVEFPVYQFVNGYQLVASEYYKLNVGWSF